MSGHEPTDPGADWRPDAGDGAEDVARHRLRRVFRRVMTVQLVALALLWWLQARYG